MGNTLIDLQTSLQSYVVAPLNAFGMGGFVFDIEDEGMAMLQADITDHYTEDNKALQDHIAIKPRRITLRGYVGEVVYSEPGQTDNSNIQQVVQKLTAIDAFLPQLSDAAIQVQQAISGIDSAGVNAQTLNTTIPPSANLYALVKNSLGLVGTTQRQQQAFQFFAGCQSAQILMGIQTPWEFLANMAVETMIAIQNPDSIFITDFSITFKQIRLAASSTITVQLAGTGGATPATGVQQQTINAQQAAPTVNQGPTPGITGPIGISNLPINQFLQQIGAPPF